MNTKQNLKQTFESISPDNVQKERMLKNIIEKGEAKTFKFSKLKPFLTAACMCLVVIGALSAYNVVKRDGDYFVNALGEGEETTFIAEEVTAITENTEIIETNAAEKTIISKLDELIKNNKDDFNGKYNGEFNSEAYNLIRDLKNSLTSYDDFQYELINLFNKHNLLIPVTAPLKDSFNISDKWESYTGHTGIDYSAYFGTEIYAIADGIASNKTNNEDSGFWYYDYGNCVIIEHGNGISTLYAHCSEVLVEVGQEIKKGDLIAKVGSTGQAYANHVHFEYRIFDFIVNPDIVNEVMQVDEISNEKNNAVINVDSDLEYKENMTKYETETLKTTIKELIENHYKKTDEFALSPEALKKIRETLIKLYRDNNWLVPFEINIGSEYEISAEWNENPNHSGIDCAAEEGTEIYATADGIVLYELFSDDNSYNNGYGNCVVLEHGNDVTTLYAHCSDILVDVWQQVKKGDLIAKVGATGWATGPHLHIEYRIFGLPVNPEKINELVS